jgi:hypothetical protein
VGRVYDFGVEAERAVRGAVGVARAQGLHVEEPIVLNDVPNVLVHLRPAPVVARVSDPSLFGRGVESLRREVRLVATIAPAPVAPPTDLLPPGPHEVDALAVTFWQFVESGAEPDPAAAGCSLREVHEALHHAHHDDLPDAHLDEMRRLVVRYPRLLEQVDRAESLLAGLPRQALHGDAHLGNVIWSSAGPCWCDWEMASAGPRELDLAALILRSRVRGRDAAAEAAFDAYDADDRSLVEALVPVMALATTAWMIRVSERFPGAIPPGDLEARLRWWDTHGI